MTQNLYSPSASQRPRQDGAAERRIAGVFCLLAVIPPLVIWYILLFSHPPANVSLGASALDHLKFTLSAANPSRASFFELAILPLLSALCGIVYFSKAARSQPVAAFLLVVILCQGLIAFFTTSWDYALLVLLPAYWGWRCLRAV